MDDEGNRFPMAEELSRARDAIQRASEHADDSTVREQLRSIDEGLMEMTHSEKQTLRAKTSGNVPDGDDLQEIEETVVALTSETNSEARSCLHEARDEIDAYRRKFTRDW